MEMCYQGRISIGGGLWEREPTGSSEGAAPAHVRALLGVRAPNRSRRRQSTTARGGKRRLGAARNRSAFLLVGSAGHRRSVIRRDAPAAPTPETPATCSGSIPGLAFLPAGYFLAFASDAPIARRFPLRVNARDPRAFYMAEGYGVAAEIQLLACGYSAQCTVRGCHARATMLARYTDVQGRPMRQRELCDRQAIRN